MTALEPTLPSARRRRAVADRSARLAPVADGMVRLTVLLPSADAGTIVLLCDEAARLST